MKNIFSDCGKAEVPSKMKASLFLKKIPGRKLEGFTALLMMVFFSSCFKTDSPVLLPPPGDVQFCQVNMTADYHRQQYFYFAGEDTLGSNFDCWDLCFDASPDGWHIWINGGNLALIANMQTTNFAAVTDVSGANWKWDEASWDADSTAIGDWRNDQNVYVMDLGYLKPISERFRKIIFQSLTDSSYQIEYAFLDGSDHQVVQVPKNELFSYCYFSFEGGGSMEHIEPVKKNWDILFTRYRYIFYDQDPPLPYLVTGVLINPGVEVAIDSTTSFEALNYDQALTLKYETKRDAIGYNWKYYDFNNAGYVVRSYINYIIRDQEGAYWKMRFVDFYNAAGEKGYPQFEFQRL